MTEGKAPGAEVESGGSKETAEFHGRKDIGGGKGTETTVIRQAGRERGRVGGGEHGQRRVGARTGSLVYWEGDR